MENKNFSALWEYYKSRGAVIHDGENGPAVRHFGDREAEYHALYSGTAIRDISRASVLRLTGKDTLDFLHRVSTNAVRDLAGGRTRRTMFLTDRGRIVDSVILFHTGGSLLCVGSSPAKHLLREWLDKYIIMDDVHPEDVSEDYALLQVWGPNIRDFTEAFGEAGRFLSGEGAFGRISPGGIEVMAARVTSTGRPEYLLLVAPRGEAPELLRHLTGGTSGNAVVLCGEDAFEPFRIEQGIPEAPREIGPGYNPHDLNLIDAVSFTKGCYIGQEVIERMEALGKAGKTLSGIIFENPVEPPAGQLTVESGEGVQAGTITSTAFSPGLRAHVALAVLKKSVCSPGARVIMKGAGGFLSRGTVQGFPLRSMQNHS